METVQETYVLNFCQSLKLLQEEQDINLCLLRQYLSVFYTSTDWRQCVTMNIDK